MDKWEETFPGERNDDAFRGCRPARVLSRREIAALMTLTDYVGAVEAGFRAYASDQAEVPLPIELAARNGTFHAKGARLDLDRPYVAVKLNGNFPCNPQRNGLPTIQGAIVLCDGYDGTLLAIMDSIEITLRRTAAATALAARYLAPKDCDSVALCGCGAQGRAQLEALANVIPLRRALVWDIDEHKARGFAREVAETLRLDIAAVSEPQLATRINRLIVTATTASAPFLTRSMIPAGAFIAAVGADNPAKSEVAPDLMAAATIVVDLLAQAVAIGDLHHAIDAGVLTEDDVHAELADVIVGRRPGRTSDDEIIVFDSTGTAIQDVATAAFIWQRAVANDVGLSVRFGAL